MRPLPTLIIASNLLLPLGQQAHGAESDTRLATLEECSLVEKPPGVTCISDVSAMIRRYDGLSFILRNIPEGSGETYHYNGGLDRTDGPEDRDGRISPEEMIVPIMWINQPWQHAMCVPEDLAKIDESVSRGEVPSEWGAKWKDRYAERVRPTLEDWSNPLVGGCIPAIGAQHDFRNIQRAIFDPADVDGDGVLSNKDDKNGDNKITAEDLMVAKDSKPTKK